MNKNDISLKNKAFFRQWTKEIQFILDDTIMESMGFVNNKNGEIFSKPSVKSIRTNYSKFKKSFASLLVRQGLPLNKDMNDESGFPQEVVEQSRMLFEFLEKHSKSVSTKANKINKRSRTPTKIAFEIARALHFCKRNRLGIDMMLDSLSSKYKLKPAITMSHLKAKVAITIKSLDSGLSGSAKKKMIKQRKKALKTKFPLSFLGDRSKNKNWVNSLKNELILSILSENKPKIIKYLDSNDKKKKGKLIKDMEKENMKTLRKGGWREPKARSL